MDNILVVTAFFDIGRGEYADFQRSSEKYIGWFKRWARMENELVVYLQDDIIIEKVKKIRKDYGLEDKTIIEKVEDVEKISPEILERWKGIEVSQDFIDYRDFKTNPENKAKYNYVNLIKSYFMADAAKKYLKDGFVAWIDFGFEHGGEVFEDENDYKFLWKYDFGKKVNIFYKNEITKDPIFKIVKTFRPDCILGPIIVSPKNMAQKFWEANLESANVLADVGFMDDDQLIYLLSLRKHPDIFEARKSDWFIPLKEYGGNHIKLKPQDNKKPSFMSRVKNKIKRVLKIK